MIASPPDDGRTRANRRGFTLVELMLAVAVVGLMAGLSITSYLGYVEKARVANAAAEIAGIARLLDAIEVDELATLPTTLVEIGEGDARDPWGNPYRYLRLVDAPGHAQARKDGFLVPINSDFDLYSMGRDGQSKPTLSNPVSHDDVIRAADGSYIGLAEHF